MPALAPFSKGKTPVLSPGLGTEQCANGSHRGISEGLGWSKAEGQRH